jgi:hypothetical protein
MKVILDGAGSTLRLDFPSAEALRAFAGDWLAREGCLVRLSEPLKLWTELTVELRQERAFRVAVEARVMQVFGGGSGGFATALQATEAGPLEAFAHGPSATAGADGSGGTDRPEPGDADADVAARSGAGGGADGEMLGASPAFRIRRMNVPQKMLLASKATRGERQILLRDASPQVLMGLLANPRIEDKEVLALAKSTSASSGVLQRIAKDRRWSTNYEVRLALVRNPQTPTPLALQMLETLRERDLRVMAKGAAVREVIRAAALRKIVKR